MRLARAAGVIAGAMLATTMTAAPPARAAVGPPPGCPYEHFCISGGPDSPTTFAEDGNWSGSIYTTYIFNHGRPYPGADHIQVTWYRAIDGSGPWTECLHYYPGPGEYYIWTVNDPMRIVSVRWRGEC
jgi:hypothetical protein